MQKLNATVENALEMFRQKEILRRPGPIRRLPMIQYEYTGIDEEDVTVEVVCNPNAVTNALKAVVRLTRFPS